MTMMLMIIKLNIIMHLVDIIG